MWMVMGLVGCHAAIRVIWWMRGPRSAWLLPSACAACVRRRRRPDVLGACRRALTNPDPSQSRFLGRRTNNRTPHIHTEECIPHCYRVYICVEMLPDRAHGTTTNRPHI